MSKHTTLSDNDCVICPGCAHQFHAIPVNVQTRIAELEAANLGLANESHCYESALLELLRQVEKFCEEQGDANFYTGDVKKVLQASSMDYQLGCIDVMNSDVDYAERMQAKAEAALADARDKALEEAAAAMDATCASGKAQHSDMIRALRTT